MYYGSEVFEKRNLRKPLLAWGFCLWFFVLAFSTREGDTSGIALKKTPTRACLEVKNVASQMTAMKHSGVERGLAFRAAHLQLLQLASYVC